jgi:hypothetical protein
MLLLGIAIGVFGTVSMLNAMQGRTPLSKGVMAVADHHFGSLRRIAASGKCDPAQTEPHLRTLLAVSGDLDAAFLPTGGDDALFARHAAGYRDALTASLVVPPPDCAALAGPMRTIGAGCKTCHQDFRG